MAEPMWNLFSLYKHMFEPCYDLPFIPFHVKNCSFPVGPAIRMGLTVPFHVSQTVHEEVNLLGVDE